MFLKSKKLNKFGKYEILELIYSEPSFSIVIEHNNNGEEVSGKIIKLPKKQLKKKYKKLKKHNFKEIERTIKETLISALLLEKNKFLLSTEGFIESKKQKEKLSDIQIEENRKLLVDSF